MCLAFFPKVLGESCEMCMGGAGLEHLACGFDIGVAKVSQLAERLVSSMVRGGLDTLARCTCTDTTVDSDPEKRCEASRFRTFSNPIKSNRNYVDS